MLYTVRTPLRHWRNAGLSAQSEQIIVQLVEQPP